MLCLNEEHQDSDGNKRKTHEKNLSKEQLIEANQVQSKCFVCECVCVCWGAEISGALQLD